MFIDQSVLRWAGALFLIYLLFLKQYAWQGCFQYRSRAFLPHLFARAIVIQQIMRKVREEV